MNKLENLWAGWRKEYLTSVNTGNDKDKSEKTLFEAIDKSERLKRQQTLESIEQVLPKRGDEMLKAIEVMKKVSDLDTLRNQLNSFGDQGKTRSNEWTELLESLDAHGVGDFVGIDLSIVRGLAYYTGFVYEAFEISADSRALAGGGRYDDLIKKLSGKVDLPAVGFAIGDVTLQDCLESKTLMPDYIDAPDIYLVAGGNERPIALRDLNRLRLAGYSVSYALKQQAFGKQFKEAGRSGAKFAIVYGEQEVLANQVKIKDLSSGAEIQVESAGLIQNLQSLEESGGIAAEE